MRIRDYRANLLIAWTYVRTATWAKLVNVIKLGISFWVSVMTRTPRVMGYPLALSIEPINVCNLKCPECPTGMGILTRPKGMINEEAFGELLAKTHKSLWHINLYFQGEPYMHPQFFNLVKSAKQQGLVVETSTNAQFLNPQQAEKTVTSGLDVLVVSLDGITQDIYQKYRVGGQVQLVLEGIRNLSEAKKKAKSRTPIIRAQFLAFSFNEHQILRFKEKAIELGADMVEVKMAQVYDVEKKKDLLPQKEALSRYRLQKDGAVSLQGQVKNKCKKHWDSAVITWKGDLVPCCFDKNAQYNMGNLHKKSFSSIWNSLQYNSFRKRVLTVQEGIDICSNCPLSRRG
ncbi:radical SAM/SPASM domain-containing protein [Labilibacter marinus]|uniref:radical SAM/SPASM domain-containing protein n=1 Tax=Labilibacter marinus TaxID=1477105 RepID=UPI0009F96F96|nr:radical SAM/SPASM domain-containing protein [Labilibacter marinus]